MCGRYQRRSDKQRIAEAFALGNVDGLALVTDGRLIAPVLRDDESDSPFIQKIAKIGEKRSGQRSFTIDRYGIYHECGIILNM